MRSIRIGFAGASGAGKTTLAEHLSRALGLPMNPVGSRSVAAEMGFASPYDVDKSGRRAEFQRTLLVSKMTWEAEHDSFVSDRTTLDNLAYAALHDVKVIDSQLLTMHLRGARRYTHIVYCPRASFQDLGSDPARWKDEAYHQIYDVLVSALVRTIAGVGPDCDLIELGWSDLTLRKAWLERELGMWMRA